SLLLLSGAACLLAAAKANEGTPAKRPSPDFDVREGASFRADPTRGHRTAARPLGAARVQFRQQDGLPAWITRYGGYLTGPSMGSPEGVARRFLARHAALFRLGPGDLARLRVGAQ